MENSRITLFEDGVYRWTYNMSLFKNPNLFLLIGKVLIGSWLAVWIFITAVCCYSDGSLKPIAEMAPVLALVSGILLGLLIIGYLIYAAIMGGYYIVDFEMDDKELVHIQATYQQQKARKLAAVTSVVGVLGHNLTTSGAGIMAGAKVSSTTEFYRLKKVIVSRRRHVMKLIGGGHNEAYAVPEDMDWLCEYIRAHCPADVIWKIK